MFPLVTIDYFLYNCNVRSPLGSKGRKQNVNSMAQAFSIRLTNNFLQFYIGEQIFAMNVIVIKYTNAVCETARIYLYIITGAVT